MFRVVSLASLILFSGAAQSAELTLLNWEDYMPESILEKFAEETGHSITIKTYDSQEEASQKVSTGEDYDIFVISSHIVHEFAEKLAPLDHNKVSNIKFLSSEFADPPYDPGNRLSVPYQWGTTGIGYNMAAYPDGVDSWSALFESDRSTLLLLDKREVFGAALKFLGYSANTLHPDEIKQAGDLIIATQEKGTKFVGALEGQDLLINESSPITHGYSGDMLLAQDENDKLTYVIPKEGCTFWVDTLAINKNSEHIDIAHAFLDFTLRPEIAAEITNSNWYASPVGKADKFIEQEILANKAIYPDSKTWRTMEFIRSLPAEAEARYEAIWNTILATD